MVLTRQQIEDYNQTGWVLARGFFAPAEVAAISRWTDALAEAPEIPGRQMVYHEPDLVRADRRVLQRIENFCPYHPEFDGLVRASRLRGAIEGLLAGGVDVGGVYKRGYAGALARGLVSGLRAAITAAGEPSWRSAAAVDDAQAP